MAGDYMSGPWMNPTLFTAAVAPAPVVVPPIMRTIQIMAKGATWKPEPVMATKRILDWTIMDQTKEKMERVRQAKETATRYMNRFKFIRYEKPERAIVRIIPHHSVVNNTTRRLQSMLYDLFNARPGKWPWQHKKGWYIAIRPTPEFWWVVKMGAEPGEDPDGEGKKRIEFYISMPKEFLDPFKTKFNNFEGWRKCTLEEVPVEELTFPDDQDTDQFKLKYARHDIFALDYDYAQQNTPVRDLLNVTNELKAGESVDLFVRCEPMERGEWQKVSEYAWEQWDKGGVPFRPGLDPMRIVRNLFTALVDILHWLNGVRADLFNAVSKTFFKDDGAKPEEKSKEKAKDPERATLLVNGELSRRTTKKRNLATFKTSMRVLVHSPDPIRRAMLSRSTGNVFDDMAGDNKLKMVKVNIRAKKELQALREWHIEDRDPNIMSVDEIGKVMQLPTRELQEEHKESLKANGRVEVSVPKAFLDDTGILSGTATDRGTTHNVHISTGNPDMTYTPRVFIGSPRMGKDQAIINMIVEAKLKHGIGAVIPDVVDERNGHRGMADAIRDHLPPEEVIDIDLGDFKNPVYLGLENIVKNVDDVRIAADRIGEEITAFLMQEDDNDKYQTEDLTRQAAKATMGDLLGMKLMLMSQEYRQAKINELQDVFDMDMWVDYDNLTEKHAGRQGQLYAPIMRRLGQIINSEFLGPIFCQEPNPAVDLYKWIEEGKVVIFRIPNGGAISERAVAILMYWLTLNVFLIKHSMGGKGKGTYLVLNEPHQFLTPGLVHFLERMLAEGPKYRMAPIFAFHHFQQFKRYPGFVDMLMAASCNWHIFKNTNENIYSKLWFLLQKTFTDPAQAFAATKGPDRKRNRPPQFIACWLNDAGEYEQPFVADALPMVVDRHETQNNSFLTKRHSRQYGRPIDDVLAEMKAKNKKTFNLAAK
jgi:hypothetical protein